MLQAVLAVPLAGTLPIKVMGFEVILTQPVQTAPPPPIHSGHKLHWLVVFVACYSAEGQKSDDSLLNKLHSLSGNLKRVTFPRSGFPIQFIPAKSKTWGPWCSILSWTLSQSVFVRTNFKKWDPSVDLEVRGSIIRTIIDHATKWTWLIWGMVLGGGGGGIMEESFNI